MGDPTVQMSRSSGGVAEEAGEAGWTDFRPIFR
jgi:hypothetical protein